MRENRERVEKRKRVSERECVCDGAKRKQQRKKNGEESRRAKEEDEIWCCLLGEPRNY